MADSSEDACPISSSSGVKTRVMNHLLLTDAGGMPRREKETAQSAAGTARQNGSILVSASEAFPDVLHLPVTHDYRTVISMAFGFAFSDIGRCTWSIPSLKSAVTLLPSASSGREKLRTKLPYARSTR